jgi:hypothetical protein
MHPVHARTRAWASTRNVRRPKYSDSMGFVWGIIYILRESDLEESTTSTHQTSRPASSGTAVIEGE